MDKRQLKVTIEFDCECLETSPVLGKISDKTLFVAIVEAMKRKEAVFLMHENEAFTTQAAANFLGVSRQYLVRLLEDGQIPFHHAGTHRRVFFKDLVQYQHQRSKTRKEKLDEMTEELVDAGVYDRFVPLERDDSER